MDSMLGIIVTQGLHGLAYGMLLFLLASGLTLIFGMMGILNLAHAAFFMLSAYISYQVLASTGNFWAALIIAPIAVAILGIGLDHFFLRRIHAQGFVGELLLTLGVAVIISEGVQVIWGTENLPFPVPEQLQGMVLVFGIEYPVYRLFVIGLAVAVLTMLALILYRTRLGMIVRAAVSDSEMVDSLGVNVPLVFMTVFGIGTWLAGVAGVAIAPILSVFLGLGDQVGMDAFIVVVTGGFGSLMGAFVVSLIFGLMNSFGIQFISQFAPLLMYIFMALVLAARPMGLFGERE
ncbi:MAG: branched-chain amino acid ABC transporter permease [bacterium]